MAGLPLEAFRARARRATADFRTVLADVPLERWWGDEEYFDYFNAGMQVHYDEHRAHLEQVLGRASD